MKRSKFAQWTLDHKHALRDLYASFLGYSYKSQADFEKKNGPSFSDFQIFMYTQRRKTK